MLFNENSSDFEIFIYVYLYNKVLTKLDIFYMTMKNN